MRILIILAAWLAGSAALAADRPNIVVILCDDLGQGDLGCYNSASKVPTPNMDRIAKEGMRFSDAHSPSSVCTPTRYGLITGRYCWRTKLKSGVLWGFSPLLIPRNRETIASLLKKNGYHAGVVGKWHLGLGSQKKTNYMVDRVKPGPPEIGFDYSYIIPASLDMEPYLWLEDGRPVEKPTGKTPGSKRVWSGGKGFWRGGPMAPSFKFDGVLPTIGQKAAGYITRQAKSKQPFFLYVPFASPHTPWVPSADFRGKTKVGAYGDFTHQTDFEVGRILKALDQTGQAKNTLVIFTSDNGSHWPKKQIDRYSHRANANWRGQKADIWEGGHRVPFLVRWPGTVKAGSTNSETVCLTDVFRTCAAAGQANVPKDAGEDSFSLVPYLRGSLLKKPIRDATVHHSVNGTFAIRSGHWKLVLGNLGSGGFSAPRVVKPKKDGPAGQLYNLAKDPSETTNLYEKQPDVVARLKKQLEVIRTSGRSRP